MELNREVFNVDTISMIIVAIGLSMDAFAVSVSSSLTLRGGQHRTGLIFGLFFGGFQMLMPLFGWVVGLSLSDYIVAFDHWIAFGLLLFIGSKMIFDSFRGGYEERKRNVLRLSVLLTLSFATSIDALMAGLSFAFLQSSIILPIVIIGAITFSLSYIGVLFGFTLGKFFGEKIKIVGGLILIGIGLKLLLDHLLFKI